MHMAKPREPRDSPDSLQRWKNICDALAEDLLLDEQPATVPGYAVDLTRVRLMRSIKEALAESPLPKNETSDNPEWLVDFGVIAKPK